MKPVETAEQKIERLVQWIADLQSGMYINCVYCGHRYGPQDKVPATMADILKQHIAKCSEHPMHAVLETLKAGRDLFRDFEGDEQVLHWLENAEAAIDKAELVKPNPATEKAKSKKPTARKARAR